MKSYIKTTFLFVILTVILVVCGRLIAGVPGMIFFLFISLVINLVSYFFSDKIALSMAGAVPAEKEQYPVLYQIIEGLCQKANIPFPKIYITPDMQPNAFATGRNPNHAAVAVTQGILQTLDNSQLEGVLAHEISHVINRDILIATIAAVMAGVITSLIQFSYFGGNSEERNPLLSILMIILAPIATVIIQLAISRQREYAADESGAHLTHKPEELASALSAIEYGVARAPMDSNQAIASLYIANPFGEVNISSLFSTHPPTSARIERLQAMEGKV